MHIHCVFVAWNNPEQTRRRWERDVRPGALAVTENISVTVVDNSENACPELADQFGPDYLWQNGNNLLYGPSLNLAVARRPEADYVLYACTRHGRALDPGWVADLIGPMERDPTVGITGHLRGSNSPGGVAHYGGPTCKWVEETYRFVNDKGEGYVPQHIQGGVFAARAALMCAHPYPDAFPHLYTDHFITWDLLKAGHKTHDVPTILSVWRESVNNLTGLKYVHAENHT